MLRWKVFAQLKERGRKMEITHDELKSLIEEPYLSRGKAYFQEGLVDLIIIKPAQVKARAVGTRAYTVKLIRKGERIDGECSCPAFEDFGPCKHMAATGFALIHHYQQGYEPSDEYFERMEFFTAIERALSKMKKEELISLILRLTNEYPEIMELLEEEL